MESQTNNFRSLSDHKLYSIDGVPLVSTDGSPHEILTLVACISGLIVAIIIISIILLALRERDKIESNPLKRRKLRINDAEAQINSTKKDFFEMQQQRKLSVFTISQSIDL